MIILVTILVIVVLVGAGIFNYQLYKLIVLDAQSRGLKHPKFWGIFSISGNDGGGGILLYLLRRRKYPSCITEEMKRVFDYRKRIIILVLICILFATGGLLGIGILDNI